VIVVLANSLTLAMSKYPMDEIYEKRLELCNLIFFGFFCFELLSKLVGRGFAIYFSDQFNWFDSAVIVISALDICL
jgi:hypothetical protein